MQVGTNDARNKDVVSDDIYDGLMELKTFSESKVPGLKVTISCPMIRRDNKWANAKLIQVTDRLKKSGLSIIENDTITHKHLSQKGLHLNQSGTKQLASNVIGFIKGI